MAKITEGQGFMMLLAAVAVLLLLVWLFKKQPVHSWQPPHLPPRPTHEQLQALKNRFNQWRNRNCPVCQAPGECVCPSPRPTMADAQLACNGQDASQGVPFSVDCINSIFSVYGCNPRYPDPNTDPADINYNQSGRTFQQVVSDAYSWSSAQDDVHRNGCYAPGGVPQ